MWDLVERFDQRFADRDSLAGYRSVMSGARPYFRPQPDPQRHELEKVRNLLFAAATGTRDEVVFTWSGEPTLLLRLEGNSGRNHLPTRGKARRRRPR